jgi:hypothetical protein
VVSESRQLLLELVAQQAESALPDRARALEELSASIQQRPPFFVDVLRPDLLDWPEVTHLLDAYGTDDADPDRFLQALDRALRNATGYGGPRPWWLWGRIDLPWTKPRCPYCKARVPPEATVCLHCGRPLPETR